MFADWVGATAAAAGLPVLWLPPLSEALCLVRRSAPGDPPTARTTASFVFLVPAHNEVLHIRDCVRSIVAAEYPTTLRRIIVIADNCTDGTAKLAREAGAECLERTDLERPGKPQAIAWALAQLELPACDAVVIVDADTVIAADFIRGLARHGPLREVVLQANFMVSNEEESWLTRLGGLLSRCRYEVSYPLKQAAGINCPLTGNGMCIGTGVLQTVGWKAFSITEDSELYMQYTIAGVRIHHARWATLYSQESSSLSQGATQRRRWMAGRLWVLRTYFGALWASRAIGRHQKLDLIVELVLSSPVLQATTACGLALALLLLNPGGYGVLLCAAALGSLVGLVASTLSALRQHPSPGQLMLDALHLPVYAGWRVLLLIRTVFTLRDRRWTRTERTTTGGPDA